MQGYHKHYNNREKTGDCTGKYVVPLALLFGIRQTNKCNRESPTNGKCDVLYIHQSLLLDSSTRARPCTHVIETHDDQTPIMVSRAGPRARSKRRQPRDQFHADNLDPHPKGTDERMRRS